MTHDEYLKRRDELLSIRTNSFCSFDKAILSLSTGSLALSITFLDKIGEPFNCITFAFIFFAWIFFFFVILFNLGSYFFARANMDRKIDELDTKYGQELKSGAPDTSPEAVFWQKRATSWCNGGAFIAFAVGVMFFVTYITIVQLNNYNKLKIEVERNKQCQKKSKQ